MKKCKYDLAVPVCWRDILKVLEWSMNCRSSAAFTAIWNVNRDRVHNYPELLESDLRHALSSCEEVFKQYRLLNSLRHFLKYKLKTPEQLGLSEFMFFYLANKENPHSADLTAQHCEDIFQSE